jgi:hypothetical protein
MSYIIYLQHIIFFLYVLPRPHTNFWEVFLFWVFCTIICCRTSVVVVSSKGKESEVKWCLLFTLLLLLLLQLTCYYGGVCVSCLVVARAISAPSLPRGLRSQMTVTSKLLGMVYYIKSRKKERKKERKTVQILQTFCVCVVGLHDNLHIKLTNPNSAQISCDFRDYV